MESKPRVIKKIALAVFKDKKILMVRTHKNDQVFYSLGGKVEEGETEKECLVREVKEEIDVDVDPDSLKFLEEFEGPAHGKENTLVNIRLYKGELKSEPKPSGEIAEVQYFDSTTDHKFLSETAIQFFVWLKERGLIN